jgi:hypothetical protein
VDRPNGVAADRPYGTVSGRSCGAVVDRPYGAAVDLPVGALVVRPSGAVASGAVSGRLSCAPECQLSCMLGFQLLNGGLVGFVSSNVVIFLVGSAANHSGIAVGVSYGDGVTGGGSHSGGSPILERKAGSFSSLSWKLQAQFVCHSISSLVHMWNLSAVATASSLTMMVSLCS